MCDCGEKYVYSLTRPIVKVSFSLDWTLGIAYNTSMHTFRIKELMANWEREHGRRLSVKELAEGTGISSPTISKMTDPKGYVTNSGNIEAMCRFFKVTPNELMFFDPPVEG